MHIIQAILASGLIIFSSAAQAEKVKFTSTGTGTAANEMIPLSDGLVVVKTSVNYDRIETDNPKNPFATATGTCFGSMVIKAGVPSGGGYCHYTDADGGMVVVKWTPEALTDTGLTQGTWMIEGGTGQWAEIDGGGTFLGGTDAAGLYSNAINGELSIP
jgi:hypothetical protein